MPVKLTFLGTGAGNFQGGRRQMSSTFVDGVLLDCGAGATGRLYDAGLFDRVDGIVISHLHSDHIAGLFDFLLHTLITGRTRPLTIVSPPGLASIIRPAIAAGTMVRDPAELYDLRWVEAAEPTATIGAWKVRSVPLPHSVYNLGYHLVADGASVYYTGDTRPPSFPEGLTADVVIHEATYRDQDAHLGTQFGHSTASQAARAAVAMKARRLFVTHIGGRDGSEAAIAQEVHAVLADATVAEDGSRYEV